MDDTMNASDLDLDAIRARCDAATPGPWSQEPDYFDGDDDGPGGRDVPSRGVFECSLEEAYYSEYGGYCDPDFEAETAADAEFIAHARTDVPALLTEVERLRNLLAVNDAMVERAAVQMCANERQESIWAILDESERDNFKDDARRVLQAALQLDGGQQ